MQAHNPVADQQESRRSATHSYQPGSSQQPGYSTTQGQYTDANQQSGNSLIDKIKRAMNLSNEPRDNTAATREGNAYGATQPGYSTMQGQNYGTEQPLHHSTHHHDRNTYGSEQPGYSTTSTAQQGQYAGGVKPPMRDHPVENVKQTMHEVNPMNNDQSRHHTTTREENTYAGQQHQPGYSATQGQGAYTGQQHQPGYSTASTTQGQYAGGVKPPMRDHPVENVKQTMHEMNPMNNDQPGYLATREGTTYSHHQQEQLQQQQQPGYSTTHGHGLTGNQQQQSIHQGHHLQGHHLQSGAGARPVLEGHVFTRLQLFATLPENLRDDTKQYQAYVEQNKHRLFETHHKALVKSVYSVTGKDLIDDIVKWLHARYAPQAGATPGTLPTTGSSTASLRVTPEILECAKLVAEGLVLSGFLTPYKDDASSINVHSVDEDFHVHDHELLVPVAPTVSELDTTSVWSVADGAIYARALKRKAGLLGQLTDGKDVYLVLNEKTRKAYLFASDLARKPIIEIHGNRANVQFDNSHYEFGVRVDSNIENEETELFNAETLQKQEELVNMWRNIGAQCLDRAGGVGGVAAPTRAQEPAYTATPHASKHQHLHTSDEPVSYTP